MYNNLFDQKDKDLYINQSTLLCGFAANDTGGWVDVSNYDKVAIISNTLQTRQRFGLVVDLPKTTAPVFNGKNYDNKIVGTYEIDCSQYNYLLINAVQLNTISVVPIEKDNKTNPIITNEIDWTQSMDQTFEYYEVDPHTWKDMQLLTTVKGCSIDRDSSASTLGSASIDVDEMVGESYIRVYLIASQNGIKSKISLGMFLVQTPTSSFDGKVKSVSMDAYTPLLELNENPTPLGYALLKGENIMQRAYQIVRNYCRAPVVETKHDQILEHDFVANLSDTWLTYVIALIRLAKYELNMDELGRILFEPQRKLQELSPIWTFNDDNSSILFPEVALKHDLYGIPNVVEVTADIGTQVYTARIENRDINSPTSIQNRGREITHRDTSPKFPGIPTKQMVDEYASSLLESLSAVEYEISYSHGYCPVRVGDCVRLNYVKAELIDVKAKIISQNLKCSTGCSVSETAVFTKNLWNK